MNKKEIMDILHIRDEEDIKIVKNIIYIEYYMQVTLNELLRLKESIGCITISIFADKYDGLRIKCY